MATHTMFATATPLSLLLAIKTVLSAVICQSVYVLSGIVIIMADFSKASVQEESAILTRNG